MKTIKQIAEELGVSKQRVYRYIKANHISESNQMHGMMYYDEVAENEIKTYFMGINPIHDVNHDVNHTVSNETAIDTLLVMLRDELEAKNKQIETQAAQITQLTEALANTATAAHALHAGTMHHLTDNEAKPEEAEKPIGIFARFFWKREK